MLLLVKVLSFSVGRFQFLSLLATGLVASSLRCMSDEVMIVS